MGRFALPKEIKQMIIGVLVILIALLIVLSFFEKAGRAGYYFMKGGKFLIGETIFLIPLIFILGGLIFLLGKKEWRLLAFGPVFLAVLFSVFGIAGILSVFNSESMLGGWLGYFISWPFLKYFGFWATQLIFLSLIIISVLIFWQFLVRVNIRPPKEEFPSFPSAQKEGGIIKKIFAPKLKVKEVPGSEEPKVFSESPSEGGIKIATMPLVKPQFFSFQPPPINLLEPTRGAPTSGDTRTNSAVIKKTLQNFGIEVLMSEVNIGPTVTQYTLKPAEGIKLSKITALSNDLSLALASHPIRIEAPVPGRSLVGIEIPNKIRAQVRLRGLIENPDFQQSSSSLLIALGQDVSGKPIYADLTRMPHLLVAGSTGTGKTIFLNSLILSLLYQPNGTTRSSSPEFLRIILVDPKRVEFPVYNNLPHLLCPVIYDATRTVLVLKWLTREMERRFDILSGAGARDIRGFNELALKNESEPMPFIVLIIDELADLMAAKGREVESAIVRLAQMARAVGIHLIVATQRPSVEVITGLIKANITSRITFQVASQVDSRTVLDAAGAEKLLGSGDMLHISTEIVKPKRIQGPYVSEREVRKVVKYLEAEAEKAEYKTEMKGEIIQELENVSEEREEVSGYGFDEEEPLYEEAKRMVVEAKRASASLLQRRLRIGYARAARLIDMLEEKGVVGPADGAKPREIFSDGENLSVDSAEPGEPTLSADEETEETWEKV